MQELLILYPKEIQRLLKMHKTFEQDSDTNRAQHKHSWNPAIMPVSVATRNSRKTEVCFKCGQVGRDSLN